ncbi:MLX interacting protein mondo isoform X2 [Lycorma delicatula]|uniref:MLX interacting protein mondo isoform X2 n=1 Tax=Lycorma delicatula TaxID=130591 RepID=UPI003F50EA52
MTIMAQTMESMEIRGIRPKPPERESIHSGHFMISDFEAEAQDDEDELAVPVPDTLLIGKTSTNLQVVSVNNNCGSNYKTLKTTAQSLSIETSLTKLFQCMSLAYRQKLTSPKWNRFKGIRLRWKDKIRLNNVIWRCWHMQFITKKNSLVCQFASPLDVDTHNKPEAVVLEGKYWKRKLNAVTAEYKKWRMFYRNQKFGWTSKDGQDVLSEMEMLDWQPHSNDSTMMVDEDYMEFMSDTLFSTISAQPFAFPDTREIARGASLADFIQPSLVQLQPNLDDFMDTLEPLQELFYNTKLPPVPEECSTTGGNSTTDVTDLYRALGSTYQDMAPEPPPAPPPPPKLLPLAPPAYQHVPTKQEQTAVQYHNTTMNLTQQQQSQNQYQYHHPSSVPSVKSAGYYNMSSYQQQQQLSPPPPPNPASNPPSPPANVYTVSPNTRTSIRSNSLPLSEKQGSQQPRNEDVFAIPKLKHRNRSRSGSCLIAPAKSHPPPLVSTASDPAINTPQNSSSALLAQLLTSSCNTGTVFTYRAPLPGSLAATNSKTSVVQDKNNSNSSSLQMTGNSTLDSSAYNFNQNQSNTSTNTVNNQSSLSTSQSVAYPSHSGTGGSSSVRNLIQPVQLVTSTPDTFMFTATPGNRRGDKTQPVPILPHPQQSTQTATLLITTPTTVPVPVALTAAHQSPQVIGSASNSPKHPNPDSPGGSESLSLSPLNMGSPGNSPLSPNHTTKTTTKRTYKEHRRVCHINAEQKRRCNIKNGFDTLHALIPQLNQNPNVKLSKAAMLQKGAEYIRQLRNERNQLKDEMDSLRQQVECLNSAISNCQSLLPATGAPVSRHRASKMKEMYYEYVWARTQENWRFWILSLICEPLLVSFNNTVSTASLDDLYRSTLQWVEQHCSLVDLRPVVLNALRHLCTSTDILSDPGKLPAEAQAAAAASVTSKSTSSHGSNSNPNYGGR